MTYRENSTDIDQGNLDNLRATMEAAKKQVFIPSSGVSI